MDEVLAVLLAAGGLLLFLFGGIFGWIAWTRERMLRRRVVLLEERLMELQVATNRAQRETNEREAAEARASAVKTGTAASDSIRPEPVPSSPRREPEAPRSVHGVGSAPAREGEPEAARQGRAEREPVAGPRVPAFLESAAAPSPPPLPVAAPVASAAGGNVPPGTTAPAARFDLERWLGIRGAAVLAGIVLVLAAFFFLQYAIEREMITPPWRVSIGEVVGLVLLFVSARLRRREHVILANSLTGAGIVMLYAAPWAAYRLYDLVPFPAAFGAMVATTIVCGRLAYVHDSQLIAVLGFVGGFATPLALSTGQDKPVALFGYVLLLDLGFLFVAQKKRWPSLAMIGLLGTLAIQALWMFLRMKPDALWFGLVVLGVFAVLFAWVSFLQPAAERRGWLPAQTGALLLPFVFVVYFAQEVDFGANLWPLAALAAVLGIAANVLARFQDASWLPVGAASGSIALVFVWLVSNRVESDQILELVACTLGLTLVFHAFAEWKRSGARIRGSLLGASVVLLGCLCVLTIAAVRIDGATFLPWAGIACILALVAHRQTAIGAGVFTAALGSALASGILAAFTLDQFHQGRVTSNLETATWNLASDSRLPGRPVDLLVIEFLIGAILCVAAFFRSPERRREASFAAAAWLWVALAFSWLPASNDDVQRVVEFGAASALGILLALTAGGARSSLLFAATLLGTLTIQCMRELGTSPASIAASHFGLPVMWIALVTVALFAAWPILDGGRRLAGSLAGRAAALAPILWFVVLRKPFVERFGEPTRFALPLAMALVVGVLARIAWTRAETNDARGAKVLRNALGASALFLACLVVPLQIDRTPLPVSLALYSVALVAFWRRADSRGIKYAAVLSMIVATAWLCLARPLDGFEHSSRRVLNWLAYLYLVPADAAVFAALWMRRREVERARGFEKNLYKEMHAQPIAASLLGLCAVLLVFTWLNLEIGDAFTEGPIYKPGFTHHASRDLIVSIAWGVYALVLLVLGVARSLAPIRWTSLVLVLATIIKVFLFDLGHLKGMQRVFSLLGLALSLIVISLLYQRFVFRRRDSAA